MSPDQVYHRLCDMKVLRVKGGRRVAKTGSDAVVREPGGKIRGRTADGKPIEGKIQVGGKSLARRLMEEAEVKKAGKKSKRRGKRS